MQKLSLVSSGPDTADHTSTDHVEHSFCPFPGSAPCPKSTSEHSKRSAPVSPCCVIFDGSTNNLTFLCSSGTLNRQAFLRDQLGLSFFPHFPLLARTLHRAVAR